MDAKTEFFAEGAISLRAILSAASREVFEVYVQKQTKKRRSGIDEKDVLVEICRARQIPVTEQDEAFFAEHAEGKTHGGLLARVGEKKLVDAEELARKKEPFLAYLCGIEDPYNFAACLRTLYAAGCDGVFLPKRNWLSAGGVLLRASAGASEWLPMATIPENSDDFLALLQENGILPLCARETRAENLYSAPLKRPLCLILGGERRGIDKTLDEKIKHGVVIPYGRDYQKSLSAQAACAVISFELLRRQMQG